MSSAVQNALQAATAAVSLAAMRLRSKLGIAIAAIMAMMATTIINSISVNPLLFMIRSLLGLPSSGLRQLGFGYETESFRLRLRKTAKSNVWTNRNPV